MSEIFRGFNFKGFAKDALAALIGGWASDTLVNKLPHGILSTLGEYSTPVLGFAIGLVGNYIKTRGSADIGQIIERAGAFMVGNWVYEMLKKESGGKLALAQPVTVTVTAAPAPAPAPSPASQAAPGVKAVLV